MSLLLLHSPARCLSHTQCTHASLMAITWSFIVAPRANRNNVRLLFPASEDAFGCEQLIIALWLFNAKWHTHKQYCPTETLSIQQARRLIAQQLAVCSCTAPLMSRTRRATRVQVHYCTHVKMSLNWHYCNWVWHSSFWPLCHGNLAHVTRLLFCPAVAYQSGT